MQTSELLAAIGLPQSAEVTLCAGRLIGITPPQSPLLTEAVRAAVAGELDVEDKLRAMRAVLLRATDWTQAADSPLSQEHRTAWAAYRQALRDLPQTYSGQGRIPWPTAPDQN